MSDRVVCEWCSDMVEVEEALPVGWLGGTHGFELTLWCRKCADIAITVGVTAMLRSRKETSK